MMKAKIFSCMLIATFGLLMHGDLIAATESQVLFENTFEKPNELILWTKWPHSEKGKIVKAAPGYDSENAALFTRPGGGWNTPILNFLKPIQIAENTIVEFDIKAAYGRGLNIKNIDDGGEYSLSFKIKPNKWCKVRLYLKHALYKRDGDPNILKDGLVGDKIGKIQIACGGKAVWIDNFKIYNSDVVVKEVPLREKIGFKPARKEFPILDQVFPFGPIIVVSGTRANASSFSQPFREQFESQLRDIKRHYCNVVSNFCDDKNIKYRLDLMKQFDLYLVETCFSNTGFSSLPSDSPYRKQVGKYKEDSNLLVWYGKDEPSDCKQYLKNKLEVNKLDARHPYASAFCDANAIQLLGDHLELVMIDPYLIKYQSPVSIGPGMNIMSYIAQTQKSVSKGKVWLIAQTFSLRHENVPSLRYPKPAEFRFGVYSSIAAGIKGILFFTYNDKVSYLDNTIRVEEFDNTLTDAWGNETLVYREVAEIGKKILPVMPSLLDCVVVNKRQYISSPGPADVLVGELQGKAGRAIVVVNKKLHATTRFQLNVKLKDQQKLYDLFALKELPGNAALELLPADAKILIATIPEKYKQLEREIQARRTKQEAEVLLVYARELQAAGFGVQDIIASLNRAVVMPKDLVGIREALEAAKNTKPAYKLALKSLQDIRIQFGLIDGLIKTRITSLDATKDRAWLKIFDEIKALSARYFKLLKQVKGGQSVSKASIAQLQQEVARVAKQVIAMPLKSRMPK